jgi:hypothetical protein
MKFISALLLTALLSYAAGFWFPWWIIAVAAFLVALLIPQSPFRAFLSGFIALFILWFALAYYLDFRNHHILSLKISEILFKQSSSLLITAVTGLLAALVGGLAALSGATCRRLFPQI